MDLASLALEKKGQKAQHIGKLNDNHVMINQQAQKK
jgi:hypothetical protein